MTKEAFHLVWAPRSFIQIQTHILEQRYDKRSLRATADSRSDSDETAAARLKQILLQLSPDSLRGLARCSIEAPGGVSHYAMAMLAYFLRPRLWLCCAARVFWAKHFFYLCLSSVHAWYNVSTKKFSVLLLFFFLVGIIWCSGVRVAKFQEYISWHRVKGDLLFKIR